VAYNGQIKSDYSNEVRIDIIVGDVQDYFVPYEFVLNQNYPNPFNPSTVISYEIPNNNSRFDQNVSITIFDVLGKFVKTLVNEYKHAGRYFVEFDASDLSTGIYYYKLTYNNVSKTKKMIFLK